MSLNVTEPYISCFIKSNFPSIYEECGPTFVLFVQKYYEWLETEGNALYYSRRLFDIKDIDETTDEFVKYFKEEYLKNIPLDSVHNIRQLIKHSLDLYRSKGTERSLKLLFRLVFGVDAKVNYPGDRLFKTSDGKWFIPTYLEITHYENISDFIGKDIIGVHSNARAFVEKAIRRKVNNRFINVLYISNIENNFRVGEKIRPYSNTVVLDVYPLVLGSLNEIIVPVSGTGENFNVGDIVDVYSVSGAGGRARVANVATLQGTVTFDFVDGGYGYRSNSTLLLSEKVLTVSGQITPELFESISQPLANVVYVNASANSLANGDALYSYYANGSLKGTGSIYNVQYSNSSAGEMMISIATGNLNATVLYTTANAVSLNATSYADKTAVANIMGWSANVAANTTRIGIYNIANTFYESANVITANTTLNANVRRVSVGSGATFSLETDLLNSETVNINTDLIAPYLDIDLANSDFGLQGGSPTINLDVIINDALNYSNIEFGELSGITAVNPGSAYNSPPFILIRDSYTAPLFRYNYIVQYANASSNFLVGELITQAFSNARGKVLSSNNTHLILKNYRVLTNNDFIVSTSNSATQIVGDQTGTTANVVVVEFDHTSNIEGLNAFIDTDVTTSNGSISRLSVIDSGFGFINEEEVTLVANDNTTTATANVYKQGSAAGYWKDRGSTPSGDHKLYDGYYWQEYSYDVVSSIELNKYQELLKSVVHTAGFIFFGTFRHTVKVSSYAANAKSSVTSS